MAITLEQFVEKLTDSGLMSAEEVSAFQQTLAKPIQDGASLAKELVRREKLTKFQAAAVFQGRTNHLVLGEYVVLDKIGQGGMGQVFKGRHRRMDRLVAIKVLPTSRVNSNAANKRFHQEVKAAARLIHPNIAIAFEAGEHKGVHYLVMEYVEGRDLSSALKSDGPFSVELALDCITQTAKGLQYAHEEGVVHRDVKPGNVLLDNKGNIKILDMGLAHYRGDQSGNAVQTDDEQLTKSGQIMGTVDYMAPEQALDVRRADARADIYSLGCTLYRLLTGEPIYSQDTAMLKIMAHQNDPIPSLRQQRPDVPEHVDRAFQKMVAKRPEDRFASMAEVIAAFSSPYTTAHRNAEMKTETLVKRPGPPPTAARTKPAARPAPLQKQPRIVGRGISISVRKATARRRKQFANRQWLIMYGGAGCLLCVVAALTFSGIFNRGVEHGGEAAYQIASGSEVNSVSGRTPTVDTTEIGFVREFSGHEAEVTHVQFSPDGSRILSSSADGTTRIWSVDANRAICVLRGHTGQVWSAVFSPDGKQVASTSQDGTMRVWDAQSGNELQNYPNHNRDRFSYVAYQPDGLTAVVNGSGDVTVSLDLDRGIEKSAFHLGLGIGMATLLAPNGKWSGTRPHRSSNWHIWDVDRQTKLHEVDLNEPPGVFRSFFAFFSDSRRVLAICGDGTLILWDMELGRIVRRDEQYVTLGHYFPKSLAVSPDGNTFLTGGGIGGPTHRKKLADSGAAPDYSVRLWDMITGRENEHFNGEGHTEQVTCVAYSPDGLYAVSSSKDKTIRLWRLPENWTPLFNGRDLAGWSGFTTFPDQKQEATQDCWRVQDGSIVCGTSDWAELATEREYSDFELEIRLRVPERGQVLLRLRSQQFKLNREPFDGYVVRLAGSADALDRPLRASNSMAIVLPFGGKGEDSWDTLTLSCIGNRVSVSVNGETPRVDQATIAPYGKIRLTNWVGDSLGTMIREVRIRELH